MGGASSNTIGGTTAAAGNVLSGNDVRGVFITGAGTDVNVVIGNYVGTNAAGTAAVANDNSGILVAGGASNNTVGGSAAADRNLVSGNALGGIVFDSPGTTGNVALGNWTGLNAAGIGIIANLAGIAFIDGSSGNSALDNVVSGNQLAGIFIGPYYTSNGCSGNLVQGNLIGTDPTGTVALGNVGPGVSIFGGSAGQHDRRHDGRRAQPDFGRHAVPASRSAAPARPATWCSATISAPTSAGTAALANAGDGVEISGGASGNTIGGTASGAGNVIAFNASYGVVVGVGPTDPSTGNAIVNDSIHANTGGGIDNDSSGLLTISSSSIAANSTTGNGGGIDNNGFPTLCHNQQHDHRQRGRPPGGGILSYGTLTVTDCTISDNSTLLSAAASGTTA